MISKIEIERFSLTIPSGSMMWLPLSKLLSVIRTWPNSYGNPDALKVARNLDTKVEDLLRQASQ